MVREYKGENRQADSFKTGSKVTTNWASNPAKARQVINIERLPAGSGEPLHQYNSGDLSNAAIGGAASASIDQLDQEGSELDLDQFFYDKRSKLQHFFDKVLEELSGHEIFALHFFLKYSKKLAKKGDGANEQSLDLMRRAMKNVSTDDIQEFLFYETDVAVQIVNDLVDLG